MTNSSRSESRLVQRGFQEMTTEPWLRWNLMALRWILGLIDLLIDAANIVKSASWAMSNRSLRINRKGRPVISLISPSPRRFQPPSQRIKDS